MRLITLYLMANSCDNEEGNLASLACFGDQGEVFLMTHRPGEETVQIAIDDHATALNSVKVTLSVSRLLIEVPATATAALKGDDQLEILYGAAATDLPEVEKTLQNILKGTGTYISEL